MCIAIIADPFLFWVFLANIIHYVWWRWSAIFAIARILFIVCASVQHSTRSCRSLSVKLLVGFASPAQRLPRCARPKFRSFVDVKCFKWRGAVPHFSERREEGYAKKSAARSSSVGAAIRFSFSEPLEYIIAFAKKSRFVFSVKNSFLHGFFGLMGMY